MNTCRDCRKKSLVLFWIAFAVIVGGIVDLLAFFLTGYSLSMKL